MTQLISTFLKLPSRRESASRLLLYMFVAYLFGVAVRTILWYQASSVEAFWIDGNPLPIWSADAGLYGYYAKQLLAGVSYPYIAEYMPGHLIAFIVNAFGFNIDWVMFLLPALLAPLIALPVVLIGHAIDQTRLGFFAALIAVIGINYYTRSYVGYMDTDVLNLFFPYMAISAMAMALTRRSIVWAVIAVGMLGGFHLWYHSSKIIIAALALIFLLISPLLLKSKKVTMLSLLILAVALATLDLSHITQRAADYFDTNTTNVLSAQGTTYHFADTLETVAEAQMINPLSPSPFYTLISPYTVLATLGFILAAFAYPVLWTILPLIALGYAAAFAGMRFTMFAAPAYALGFIMLFALLSNYLQINKKQKVSISLIPIFATAAASLLMLFNIFRVNPSFYPAFFDADDVNALKTFRDQSSDKDLLISWWDYGWPLWYYTGRNNTLIDNGRHGTDTYLVANALTSEKEHRTYNLLRYTSEMQRGRGEVLPQLAKSENLGKLFSTLTYTDLTTTKSRETYILLHRDMLLTFQTMQHFGNINLHSGKYEQNSNLYISDLTEPFNPSKPIVQGDTFTIDLRSGTIKGQDGAQAKLKGIITVENGSITASKGYHQKASMHIIIYNRTKAIYLDNALLNSFLIKAQLLNVYDRTLFEEVAATDKMKILRLK